MSQKMDAEERIRLQAQELEDLKKALAASKTVPQTLPIIPRGYMQNSSSSAMFSGVPEENISARQLRQLNDSFTQGVDNL